MLGIQRLLRPLAVVLALGTWLLFPGERADGQTVTPEQLQIFQGLTPEQQQAILNALGSGALGQTSSGQQLPGQFGRGRQLTGFPQSEQLRETARERMKRTEGEE